MTEHAKLRQRFRNAAEHYWRVVTDCGWSPDQLASARRELANAALRLHLFELGRRSAKR